MVILGELYNIPVPPDWFCFPLFVLIQLLNEGYLHSLSKSSKCAFKDSDEIELKIIFSLSKVYFNYSAGSFTVRY